MQIRSKKCTEMCNKKYFLEKRDDKMGNEVLQPGKKFCKHCGQQIDKDCVVCPVCGKQVEDLKSSQQPVVINNTNANTNSVDVKMENRGTEKNKWVAFVLCLFLGLVGAHKFYEGKILVGVVYIFTAGLFFVGWIIDLIAILMKPNPYYV
nr:MAG TPA: TM2 domain [Caudoviricetes sp.]